jgi:lipoprotein-releasing system permease protein
MNVSLFIAKKLTGGNNHSATERIIRIASSSVAISLVVMILAIGIVKGFQKEIKSKATGFSGHLIIKNLDLNQSGEWALFPRANEVERKVKKLSFVTNIFPICLKSGILRTAKDAEGIQCKGVVPGYGDRFLKSQITRGKSLLNNDTSDLNEILISEVTANRLNLDTGQRVELYFIQDGQVRRRKPKICGIFNTGIYEIDKTWILADIRMIQRIYTMGYDSISGYEVFLNSLENLRSKSKLVNEETGLELTVQSVDETHYQIFQWLQLLDMNVMIIIILMVLVSVVNMMTALLVLIIDRTPMIGLLKAMGARNRLIRQSFLYSGSRYMLQGLVWGNIIGLGIGFLQKITGWLKLKEETYYLSKVPFEISILDVLMINGLTFGVCFILLIIPAMYVSGIQPVKAIRFN